MTDDLRALAEAATAENDPWGYWRDAFTDAVSPTAVLALLDEVERLNGVVARMDSEVADQISDRVNAEAENVRLRDGYIRLNRGLSRVDYVLGEPNEMKCSLYDVFPDGNAVVERVAALKAENARLREALMKACDWLERLVRHYDPDDEEEGLPEIQSYRAALGDGSECICGGYPADYEGFREDCPVHGWMAGEK